ncbi:hypothetical protein C5167_028263 [Papaver somniferum]|nr:hypothetical protein C5167_028263 [Papaver somniferum]
MEEENTVDILNINYFEEDLR